VLEAGTILVLRIYNIRNAGAWFDFFDFRLSLIMEYNLGAFSPGILVLFCGGRMILAVRLTPGKGYLEACFILARSTQK